MKINQKNEEDTLKKYLSAMLRHMTSDYLSAELKNKHLKKLYNLTGTGMTIKEISKITRMSSGSISYKWQEWFEKGLLTKKGKLYERLI